MYAYVYIVNLAINHIYLRLSIYQIYLCLHVDLEIFFYQICGISIVKVLCGVLAVC